MSALILTPIGRQQAEDTRAVRGPKYAILAYLYELDAPTDVEEVIEHLNIDEVKAQMILKSLINDELIQEV